MSRPKQVQTTTNNYEFKTPQETDAIRRLREYEAEDDPSFGQVSSDLKRRNRESRNSLLGPYTTPEQRLQADLADNEEASQVEAQARRGASFDRNRMRYGQLHDIAELTRPQLVNTGGTTTSSSSGGFFGNLLSSGLQVGGMALL